MQKYDLIVIGGVAAGTKAAAKARREKPDWSIAIITKDHDVSYAGCGLPYYIGDVIQNRAQLVVRNPETLKLNHGLDVLMRHNATSIDRTAHTVSVENLETGEKFQMKYGKLVLATGASALRPPIPGIDSERILTLRTVMDADAILARVREMQGRVVVVGGGFIGIEMAENLKIRGWDVTIVEMLPQILPPFDLEIALMMQKHLEKNGVKVMTGTCVESFSKMDAGVEVATSNGNIAADFVILSIGIKPNSELAKDAGLELGCRGTVRVDRAGRTSDPDIFAAGDCASTFWLLSGSDAWSPMGSSANKQARATALTLTGTETQFPGVLGTMIVKAFGFSAARTGLNEREARDGKIETICVTVPADDRAHYHPGSEKMAIKLLAHAETGEILGCQAYGLGAVDKPADVLATAISMGATVHDIANVDFTYAPPFSTAINPVNLVCYVLENKMSGKLISIGAVEAQAMIESSEWDGLLLDPREVPEFMIGSLPGAVNIPMSEFPARLSEIDAYKDRPVLVICNYGRRAYEAFVKLRHAGFVRAKVLEGGTKFWPYELE
jgi:NADPH-dependent 2,4-dienoyl-CoA reductase/sulfur reductase-like enzyme/rhodanese-related sulfurtransferase